MGEMYECISYVQRVSLKWGLVIIQTECVMHTKPQYTAFQNNSQGLSMLNM